MIPIVYILSSSHSGSTLLAFLLNAHPRIVSVGELSTTLKESKIRPQVPCSCGHSLAKCQFWQQIFKEVTESGVEFSPTKWSVTYDYFNPILRKIFNYKRANAVLESIRQVLIRVTPFHLYHIAKVHKANIEAIKSILRNSGKDIFVDASKRVDRLEYFLKIKEFDTKVIWLVRDVRGFVNSQKRKNIPAHLAATRWRKEQIIIKTLFQRLPESRRFFLRYEDLCQHYEQKLRELFAFIGVEPLPVANAFREVPHHILGNYMRLQNNSEIKLDEKWRILLTEEEQDIALSIGRDVMSQLGYTVSSNKFEIA